MTTPEAQARTDIDRLLEAAGWHVCNVRGANVQAVRGVAFRELPLAEEHGEAGFALRVNGKSLGISKPLERLAMHGNPRPYRITSR